MVAETPMPPVAPVRATVHAVNAKWTLLVAPTNGWVPSWRKPMLALVIVICIVMGVMLLRILVSRHQQAWLLAELKVGGGALGTRRGKGIGLGVLLTAAGL